MTYNPMEPPHHHIIRKGVKIALVGWGLSATTKAIRNELQQQEIAAAKRRAAILEAERRAQREADARIAEVEERMKAAADERITAAQAEPRGQGTAQAREPKDIPYLVGAGRILTLHKFTEYAIVECQEDIVFVVDDEQYDAFEEAHLGQRAVAYWIDYENPHACGLPRGGLRLGAL